MTAFASDGESPEPIGLPVDAEPPAPTTARSPRRVPRKILLKVWWRYFLAFDVSFNWERMEAVGFAWTLSPALRWLHPDDAKYSEALRRHLAFFNSDTVIGVPLILGATVAMEESLEPGRRSSLKASLMGPLAGIGDTLTFTLYNSVIFIIGATYALRGSIFGPIFVLVLMVVPYTVAKWIQFDFGYRKTRDFTSWLSSGVVQKLTTIGTVFGLIALGGFVPSSVRITATSMNAAGASSVQHQLDSVVPYLLPMAVTFLAYACLKYLHLSPLWTMFILAVIGIGLGWLGWFAPT